MSNRGKSRNARITPSNKNYNRKKLNKVTY